MGTSELSTDIVRGESRNVDAQLRRIGRGRVLVGRIEGVSFARFALIALAVYVIASLGVYYPLWPGTTHLTVGYCPCGDVVQEMWFLKWTPWALLHGHNVFFTNWMGYPHGGNLASNTAMPALALLMAPVTLIFGPVSSYNLLMWLAFPVSAFACFYVARKVTNSNLAAVVAGALYGFSPLMAAQGLGHAFLIFIPLPPLILYVLWRVVAPQEGSARRAGIVLGVMVVVQYLISQEVAALTGIVALVAGAILWLANRQALDSARTRYIVQSFAYAGAISLVVLAYPIYYQLFGPLAVRAAAHATTRSTLKLDVLGTVVPDSLQAIDPTFLTRTGNAFMGTDLAENGSYLGAPLVAALVFIVWTMRRDRRVLFIAAVLGVVEVFSMGRWFTVANHTTPIPMPWAAFAKIPLLSAVISSRFAILASFFVALLVAFGVARWISWDSPSPAHGPRRRRTRWGLGVLAASSAAFYLPQFPIATVTMSHVPSFFTSSEDRQIPAGSVVLPFPLTTSPYSTSMYWQIQADFRWKMIGGELITVNSRGHITGKPVGNRPIAVAQFLSHLSGAATVLPPLDQRLVGRMHEYLFLNQVGTVVLDPTAPHAAQVLTLFRDTMGPPVSEGGVDVWFHAQVLGRRYSSAPAG